MKLQCKYSENFANHETVVLLICKLMCIIIKRLIDNATHVFGKLALVAPTTKKRAIAYLALISGTHKQSRSERKRPGLGQQIGLIDICAGYLDTKIEKIYYDHVSSRNVNFIQRAEFQKATDHAKRTSGCLIISDITRLVRGKDADETLAEILKLKNCGLNCIDARTFTDLAKASDDRIADIIRLNKLSELAGQRSKILLKDHSPKRSNNPTPQVQREGKRHAAAHRKKQADELANFFFPIIDDIKNKWPEAKQPSLRQIAAALNERGYTAPRGGEWSAMGVRRVIKRYEKIQQPIESDE